MQHGEVGGGGGEKKRKKRKMVETEWKAVREGKEQNMRQDCKDDGRLI